MIGFSLKKHIKNNTTCYISTQISLGAGNPNPNSFPFKSMTVTLNDGQNYTIAGDDMADALQYGPTVSKKPNFVKTV